METRCQDAVRTRRQVQIDRLSESTSAPAIIDVPDNQGGWVRVSFERSGYDSADEDGLPVTGYEIHQRVDSNMLDLGAPVMPPAAEDPLGPQRKTTLILPQLEVWSGVGGSGQGR